MLRSLFVVAILVPGIAAALANRFAALLLYLWFALFRPQEWMWVDISAFRPSLLLGAILVLPCLMSGIMPYFAHPLSVGAVLFFIASLLGQIDAVKPDIAWNWLDYLFRLVFVCLLAVTLVSDQKRFRWTLAIIAGSFGVHAAKAGFVSLLGGGVRMFDGLAGAFGDNNGYAVGMVMIAPLLLAVSQIWPQRWVRLAFKVAAPLTAVAVVSTFSRGGFLALTAAALTLALLHRRRVLAFAAIAVIAVPLGWFMSSQEGYLDRLQTIRTYDETNEESALSRLHFWRVAVDMAADNPLGVGLFNYEAQYNRYDFLQGRFGQNRSVHSSHFQVLAETGFLGGFAWVMVFVVALRAAFRIRRRGLREDLDPDDRRLFLHSANGLIVSMTAFLVGGSFVAMALNDLTWLTFALVTALDLISARVCEAADRAPAAVSKAKPILPALTWRPVGARAS